jgi:serine/threonine-protein kinase
MPHTTIPGFPPRRGARLELLHPLAAGSRSRIWVARHPAFVAEVAVKIVDPADCNDPLVVAKLRRSATVATAVRCPHVVAHLDQGTTVRGAPFVVMELLSGETLADWIDRAGPLPLSDVLSVVGQAALALEACHRAGFIHRDVKPSNLFLAQRPAGMLKLLDLGSAWTHDDGPSAAVFGGTPLYMSPELLSGAAPDPADDLWSLAVVAYEAMTGRAPFAAESYVRLVASVRERSYAPPSELRSELDAAIDAWFERATHRRRSNRFRDADELAGALREAVAGLPAQRVEPPPASQPPRSGRYSYIAELAPRRATRRRSGVVPVEESKATSQPDRADDQGAPGPNSA